MKAKKSGYIRIFDTTLRDGEQTPGVSLTMEDKIEIARQLSKLGVDVIEAGSPMSSEGEKRVVKEIAKAGLEAEICGLARATKGDIDDAIDCDVDVVHVFIPTSPVQMKYAVNMTPEQVLSATFDHVDYVKKHGLKCEFSPMDATRSELGFLKKVCQVAEEAEADMLNIPDTVGIMIPKTMGKLIEDVRTAVKTPISIHCHDDFGMAVANSLAAVESSATQVHATINGLGERAGNASLEEVVMALHMIYKLKTGINSRLLYSTSRMVSTLTGVFVQANKAIVGENAFAHESGIHTRGVTVKPLTFEPIKPELVGRTRKLVAGKLAGTRGIKAELEEIGIHPTDDQMKEIVQRVKELGDKGKMVTDADLLALTSAVMGEVIAEEKIVDLCDMAVVTGIKVIPTASVRLVLDGKEYIAAETGVGPVDSVLKAIQKLTSNLAKIRLNEYRLEAITGGSNAVAEVVIKVEDEKGNIVSARAAREDIVMASVEAMINGINKCLIKKRKLGKKDKVAFQGERGAYSESAVYTFFGNKAEVKPCRDLTEVFEIADKQEVPMGVVPIENSLEGSVNQTYDLFLTHDLKVTGEIIIRISHCLIANPTTCIEAVKTVYSHPQALAQCRSFLERLGSDLIPTYDTAGSVKMLREKGLKDAAAVASETAAEIYGMKILAREIEDTPTNYTRFFVISKNDAPITGKDKTSIIFAATHTPGALYHALGEFAKRDINLAKIESRPTKQKPWEYNFYLDFEGHRTEEHCTAALKALEKYATFIKILGSYPKAESPRV